MASLETDNITPTVGCNQVINKPNHFMNGVSSSIDLTFFDLTRETKNLTVRSLSG